MNKRYQCAHCHYMTTRLYNFKRHCKCVHKTVVENQQSETGQERYVTFQCTDCQYKTKRFYDFKRHNKVVHNTKVAHYQNVTSQIDSENTNIKYLNKDDQFYSFISQNDSINQLYTFCIL